MALTDAHKTLPNIAEILGPVLQRVSREQQPLLLAIAERRAAQRYRDWAKECADQPYASQLAACAEREEQIASHVEGLSPDAVTIQQTILSKNPDLEEINRSIFADRPLMQQFTIQAQGERLGAATWRAFAENEKDPVRSSVFWKCAELEEQSAVVLEAILGASR